MKRILATLLLLPTFAFAGEVHPLSPLDKETLMVGSLTYACEEEQLILDYMDNFPALPEGCLHARVIGGPLAIDIEVVAEYRYLDDQGDTTVVYSLDFNGKTYWTANQVAPDLSA